MQYLIFYFCAGIAYSTFINVWSRRNRGKSIDILESVILVAIWPALIIIGIIIWIITFFEKSN